LEYLIVSDLISIFINSQSSCLPSTFSVSYIPNFETNKWKICLKQSTTAVSSSLLRSHLFTFFSHGQTKNKHVKRDGPICFCFTDEIYLQLSVDFKLKLTGSFYFSIIFLVFLCLENYNFLLATKQKEEN